MMNKPSFYKSRTQSEKIKYPQLLLRFFWGKTIPDIIPCGFYSYIKSE
jgi:hypothetical protein